MMGYDLWKEQLTTYKATNTERVKVIYVWKRAERDSRRETMCRCTTRLELESTGCDCVEWDGDLWEERRRTCLFH